MKKGIYAPVAVLMLTLSMPAWAVLGGKASSVQSDQVQMKAVIRPGTQTAQYSVQTLQTPSGITIKEFVDSNGNVFAVTWQGPIMPDLKQLLGQYFNTYVTAARNRHGDLHHLSVTHQGLVVNTQGHMRAFTGIAYLPAKLPAGVTPSELH